MISTPPPTSWSTRPAFPLALRYFGGAGLSHMKKYGTPLESFAKIRAKASRHAKNNPLALFRKEVTADDVMKRSGDLAGRDDAADGLSADLRRARPRCWCRRNLPASMGCARTSAIAAQAMTTDTASTFDADDMMQVVGFDMARAAANSVYEAAGIGPEDLDVVELHDCFAQNELITYEALGALSGRRRREVHRRRRQHLRRQGRHQSFRRPACRRGIRSARPALRNATS